MHRNHYVTKNPGGGWDAKAEGASCASSHHRIQAKAEAGAKGYARNLGGAELHIHGVDDRIRHSDTVPLTHDPNQSKDMRH